MIFVEMKDKHPTGYTKVQYFSINVGSVKTFYGNFVFKRINNQFTVPDLLTIYGLK